MTTHDELQQHGLPKPAPQNESHCLRGAKPLQLHGHRLHVRVLLLRALPTAPLKVSCAGPPTATACLPATSAAVTVLIDDSVAVPRAVAAAGRWHGDWRGCSLCCRAALTATAEPVAWVRESPAATVQPCAQPRYARQVACCMRRMTKPGARVAQRPTLDTWWLSQPMARSAGEG